MRMEDLDTPRVQPGAADSILADLEAFGFTWDGPVMYQSTRTDAYREAFDRLRSDGFIYPCGCSRKDTEAQYPGTCANGLPPGKVTRSWRVRVNHELAETTGDFVLLRADGIFAYQLAVVVDDEAQGITNVVRGADLLDSTPRQMYLQHLLGYRTPHYRHIPVVVGPHGQKLSKQNGAMALDKINASVLLVSALQFLGYSPPANLGNGSPAKIWQWALPL